VGLKDGSTVYARDIKGITSEQLQPLPGDNVVPNFTLEDGTPNNPTSQTFTLPLPNNSSKTVIFRTLLYCEDDPNTAQDESLNRASLMIWNAPNANGATITNVKVTNQGPPNANGTQTMNLTADILGAKPLQPSVFQITRVDPGPTETPLDEAALAAAIKDEKISNIKGGISYRVQLLLQGGFDYYVYVLVVDGNNVPSLKKVLVEP
jgi:hypothetical protein